MRQQLLYRDSRGATSAGNPPSVRIHPRGAPGTVPEMRLDLLGIRNFYLRVHIMTRERRQELAVHFRTPPPEIDNWLTAPLNGINHLQSEAKLHSKTGTPCEAS